MLDASTGQLKLFNIFGVMAQLVGFGTQVPIPDLVADTNGDGSLDTGDVLYSLVDLVSYLAAVPPVAFGTTYDVLDGRVAGLPGMQFSTTPFSFDPMTGFTGTPYAGPATTEGIHLPSAIPEPSTLGLLSVATGLAGLLLRHRRRCGCV